MPILRAEFVEFVRGKMNDLNLNPYGINRKSGDRISHMTVWNILNYQVKEVKDETVEILAKALGVSSEELHRIARGSNVSPDEDVDLRALDYLKAMPQSVKADAVAILEILWRRHSDVGMPVNTTDKEVPAKSKRRKAS